MKISKSKFGNLNDGTEVQLFSLENDNQINIDITNYGGIITRIFTPDRNGKIADIVLGFDNLDDYLGEHPYFGAIIGRYANRIAAGKFSLNGKDYNLAVNNGPNHLHGGIEGFDKKVWTPYTEVLEDQVSLKLAYESAHMEEGYPGNLLVEVEYALNNNNELIINYKAGTDRDTIINLTNHSYFNLNPDLEDILGHQMELKCSEFTPLDENSVPTGEIKKVNGTAFDFTKLKKIGDDFAGLEMGYDQNLIIDKAQGEFKWFGKVIEQHTGRTMHVGTTEPGVQFYTANYVDNIKGKEGKVYNAQSALCLETQHFPDSPNKPAFPSVILRKNEQYTQKTIYRFGVE